MKRIVLSALIAVFAVGFTTVPALAAETFEMDIMQSGKTVSAEGVRPIYTIMVGDPVLGEKAAAIFSGFGPFALNATVYTRTPDQKELWFGVYWKRPANIKEAEQLEQEYEKYRGEFSRTSFYKALPSGSPQAVLPPPFNHLTAGSVALIDAVVKYADGSMRIYLALGTTIEGAEQLIAEAAKSYTVVRR